MSDSFLSSILFLIFRLYKFRIDQIQMFLKMNYTPSQKQVINRPP